MAKAQLIVIVDDPAEGQAVADWFGRWDGRLRSVSDNRGCGCCVDIWDVDGPAEAFRELPAGVVSGLTDGSGAAEPPVAPARRSPRP